MSDASPTVMQVTEAQRVPRGFTAAIGWVLLVATVAYVTMFLFVDFQGIFHSDAALKSVIADVALHEGRGLPHGWTFANGDLLTLTPYVLLVVLTPVMGLGYASNATATWLCYLLLLLGAAFLMRRMMPRRPDLLVACLVLVGCALGAANLEFLISQGAYSLYAACALPLFALMVGDGVSRRGLIVIAGLSALLASANPTRALAMVYLPLLAALPVAAFFSGAERWRNLRGLSNARLLALLGGAALGAAAYYSWLLPSVSNYDAAARISLATPQRMLEAATNLPGDWFGYFTIAGPWAQLGAGFRVLQLFSWTVAIGIVVAPALMLRSANPQHRRLAWLFYALLGSGTAPMVLFNGLYFSATEMRYCTLAILVGIIMLLIAIDRAGSRRPAALSSVLLLMMVFGTITAMTWQRLGEPTRPDARGVSLNDRNNLIEQLRKRHIGTGMATYWNSHVVTVLSSGGVMLHPVAYGDRLSAFPHHVPHAPREGSFGPRQAVVLTKSEFAVDQGGALTRQLGAAEEAFDVGPYHVLVYTAPITDAVYGEGYRFDEPAEPGKFAVDTGVARVDACESASGCKVTLHLRNTGQATLASAGDFPMRIGLQGLDAQGNVVGDLGRIEFPLPLAPGAEVDAQATLAKVPDGVIAVRPCLLQEMVSWLCARTSPELDDPGVINAAVPAERLGISLSALELAPCTGTSACSRTVTVTNTGRQVLATRGRFPLRIGVQALRNGSLLNNDAGRVDFPAELYPQQSAALDVQIPDDTGATVFRLCLLQENVAWHCARTSGPAGATTQP
ncbi:hypothetical protein [Lysobacter sp. GCM10012299]|uniref:hypothetical protein n=1 Tax=Lysobacter sp. GCM10012299 TaxID=3317333 RepID=UPI00360D3036